MRLRSNQQTTDIEKVTMGDSLSEWDTQWESIYPHVNLEILITSFSIT